MELVFFDVMAPRLAQFYGVEPLHEVLPIVGKGLDSVRLSLGLDVFQKLFGEFRKGDVSLVVRRRSLGDLLLVFCLEPLRLLSTFRAAASPLLPAILHELNVRGLAPPVYAWHGQNPLVSTDCTYIAHSVAYGRFENLSKPLKSIYRLVMN